jgi:hypothetical protein
MLKTAKTMYEWTTNMGSDLFSGGDPPNLDDIKTKKGSVNDFVNALLGHHTHVKEEVKRILVANGIRFYSDFVEFLRKEPLGKYDTESKLDANPFIREVSVAVFLEINSYELSKISMNCFLLNRSSPI